MKLLIGLLCCLPLAILMALYEHILGYKEDKEADNECFSGRF